MGGGGGLHSRYLQLAKSKREKGWAKIIFQIVRSLWFIYILSYKPSKLIALSGNIHFPHMQFEHFLMYAN